jgi:hypothetical protein
MGENRTDHRAAQQQSGNGGCSRNHKQNPTNDLQETRKVPKPLADADFSKQFNPEDLAAVKLHCSEIQEQQSRKTLENPEQSVRVIALGCSGL